MGQAQGRHYGMDWLRIGAFQLLILYHVGMAFVPWDFQVKDANPPIAWATVAMLLTNPWRLSLLFAVSGYASAALFARQKGGIGGFLRSRIARLAIPLLFGMAVLVTPQPWVWLITHYGYRQDFGSFLLHDYYSFRSIDGVIVPTWMHLWFIVYLLGYTMALCLILALPAVVRRAGRRACELLLAGPGLLPLGVLFVYIARGWFSPGWEDNHLFYGDWGAHANYFPVFLFGYLLRGSEPLRAAIARWWGWAAAGATIGWLILAWFEITYGLRIAPPALWPLHGFARSLESWGAMIALMGVADRYWNFDSKWRPLLAEAVFPFYLIHQTIIILVGYWLLSTATGPLARFVILVAATMAGCWIFYLGGREVRWLRPLIGLRAGPGRRAAVKADRGALRDAGAS
ncbi:acyltransferase [Sphingomonas abietis]|uniref:Acyltransferase n=2 Tax=Sphingomonas abietis TaxID=3012344 RepID=A0ABY7NTE1_9SPHN|nr:acyltransferase [Sphingomonas abietis]